MRLRTQNLKLFELSKFRMDQQFPSSKIYFSVFSGYKIMCSVFQAPGTSQVGCWKMNSPDSFLINVDEGYTISSGSEAPLSLTKTTLNSSAGGDSHCIRLTHVMYSSSLPALPGDYQLDQPPLLQPVHPTLPCSSRNASIGTAGPGNKRPANASNLNNNSKAKAVKRSVTSDVDVCNRDDSQCISVLRELLMDDLQCFICEKIFVTGPALLNHVKSHHALWQCDNFWLFCLLNVSDGLFNSRRNRFHILNRCLRYCVKFILFE